MLGGLAPCSPSALTAIFATFTSTFFCLRCRKSCSLKLRRAKLVAVGPFGRVHPLRLFARAEQHVVGETKKLDAPRERRAR